MSRLLPILLAAGLVLAGAARAQEFDPAAMIGQADEWISENIDDDALEALGVDRDRTREFLSGLHQQFRGTNVHDLATWRDLARQLEPVLAAHEETAPYAVWLRAHLDDFEVSRQLRQEVPPAATNRARLPEPTPQLERTVWVKVVARRPAPGTVVNKQVARFKAIFTEEKAPPELVWIAEVESGFNARARSPAGAAGMFQLMPATARGLGMSVGFFHDERFDAEKSARVAARYLRGLHGRFGDWRLTFAAYNAGPGRVAALLKERKARTFDEIARFLPLETRMYVPKVEAVIRKREGVGIAALKMPKA
jgi:membrane-bound lytic murein transglycosylase D